MSTEIDKKVVEMRFDNSNFESNVKTSMSTIEKLKAKLSFDKETKSMQNLQKASDDLKMSKLETSIEAVSKKFSAMEIVGITALANITNSVINAGKQMLHSLTIGQLTSGFNEYELKMGSVQTIMASTGENIDVVNKYLEELNTYSDKTIYSFADMTNNIGKFTNAGVKLEDAVAAIKGISNEAALSGANANEASRAMYNFSQALASGYVKLIDWKSIENANMATAGFKQQLIDTAVELGTLTKTADGMYSTGSKTLTATKEFNDSLQDGWMTTEVLTKTLKVYADENTEIGKKAYAAAQDVKTFSMMVDTLKEACQSGWSQTFELIFGNLEDATELWTDLTNTISKFVDGVSNARNNLLKNVLSSKYDLFSNKIKEAGVNVEDFEEKLTKVSRKYRINLDRLISENGSLANVVDKGLIPAEAFREALNLLTGDIDKTTESMSTAVGTITNLGEVVNKVINGDFGNGTDRVKALTEAGYDYSTVQDLVNKTLAGEVVSYEKLSEAQMENLGYTEDQIKAIQDLQKQAKETGTPISELIDQMNTERPSGRQLLLDIVHDRLTNISRILGAVKKAWSETFTNTDDHLYNMIKGFRDMSHELVISEKDAELLSRSFKGIFAVIDLVTSVLNGGLKLALRGIANILGWTNLDILEITANIGDTLVKIRDWVKKNNVLIKGYDKFTKKIGEWFRAFKNLPQVQKCISAIHNTFNDLIESIKNNSSNILDGLNEFVSYIQSLDSISLDNIPKILDNFKKMVLDKIFDFGTSIKIIKENIKSFFEDLGSNMRLAGEKIGAFNNKLIQAFLVIKKSITETIGFGEIFTMLMGVGMVKGVLKLGDVLEKFASPLQSIIGMFDSLKNVFKSISGAIDRLAKAKAFQMRTKGIVNLAIAIGILAGSVWLLAQIPKERLSDAIGRINQLALIIIVLAYVGTKLTSSLSSMDDAKYQFLAIGVAIAAIGGALLLMALALKTIDGIDSDHILEDLGIMLALCAELVITAFALSRLAPQLSRGAFTLLAISGSLYLMTTTIEKIDSMEVNNVGKVILAIGLMVGAMIALMTTCRGVGGGAALPLIAMAISMKLLISVIDDIAKMKLLDIIKGVGVMVSLVAMMMGLMISTSFAGQYAARGGAALLLISVVLGIMVLVIKLLGKIKMTELLKSVAVIAVLGYVFGYLIAMTSYAGKNVVKAGATLVLMAAAMVLLTGVIVVLSKIPIGGLFKAVAAISVLMTFMGGVIALTAFAKEAKSTLVLIAVTIGILAISLAGLSMIETDRLLGTAKSLSLVMAAFAAVIASTSQFKKIKFKDLLTTCMTLVLVIGAIGGVLALLSNLPMNPQTLIPLATGISELLIAMAGSMAIINKFGKIDLKTVGIVALMTAVVAGLAVIIGLLAATHPENVLEICVGLSLMLLSLSGSIAILSLVGVAAGAVLPGLAALGLLIAGVAVIITALGALAKIDGFKTLLHDGAELFGEIGYAIGNFIGSIVGGLSAGLLSGLPDIGTYLSEFMTNLQPFIDITSSNNVNIAGNVKDIVSALLLITAAEFIDGIASLSGRGSTMIRFSEQLTVFGNGLVNFAQIISQVGAGDWYKVSTAANAGLALANMSKNIAKTGGIVQFITGETDMNKFSLQIQNFGRCIVDFAETVKDLNEDGVEKGKRAGDLMTALASGMPKTGGLLQFITGETDMGLFGLRLQTFGRCIVAFCDTVKDIDVSGVENSQVAGKAFVELSKLTPKTGGLVQFITGETDMGLFGTRLESFGRSIVNFTETVYGIKADAANKAAIIAQTFAELATVIPEDGGIMNLFNGSRNIEDFGDDLEDFGESIVTFAETVGGIDSDEITSVANASKIFADIQNMLPKNGEKVSLENFGSGLEDLASGIEELVESLYEIDEDDITEASNIFDRVIGIAKGINAINLSDLQAFSDTFKNLGTDAIQTFIDSMTDRDFEIRGVIKTILTNVALDARTKYDDFKQAGRYVVAGFVNGIREKLPDVKKAGKEIGKTAEEATKEATEEHSPSKVFEQIGKYVSQGFTIGIDKNNKNVKKSATNMAKIGIEATKSVMKSLKSSSSIFKDYYEETDSTGTKVGLTMETAANAFVKFRNSVRDSLKSASGLFDEFSLDVSKSSSDMIYALQSQVSGIEDWANNLKLLYARGLSQNLIKALYDLGVSAAGQIEMLTHMTDKELKKFQKAYNKRIQISGKAANIISSLFLNSKELQKSFKIETKTIAEGTTELFKVTETMNEKVSKVVSWNFKNAKDEIASTLNYGKGVFEQFAKRYLKSTKNITLGNEALTAGKKALEAYATALYKQSDYYKEDNNNLKQHKKDLSSYEKRRRELITAITKAENKGTTKSKAYASALKKELKSVNASIKTTNAEIAKDQDTILKHTKETFAKAKQTIKDSVSTFLDPLKMNMDAGVDLFTKFETNDELLKEDKKKLAAHKKTLSELEKTQKSIQNKIAKNQKTNTIESRKRVKTLNTQLDEVTEKIDNVKSEIEQDQNDISTHSEISTKSILDNMRSQVNGVSAFQTKLKKLSQKGVTQGLVDKLKDMGTSGVNYVDQFLKMSSKQIEEANTLYNKTQGLNSQSLLNDFKDKLTEAKNWATDMQTLATMGFNKNLVQQIGDLGIDGYSTLKAFISMTPAQVKQFNKEYADSLTLPDTVADQVMSSYVMAGGNSVKGFTSAINNLVKDGASENKAFKETVSKAGKIIYNQIKSSSKKGIAETITSITKVVNQNIGPLKKKFKTMGAEVSKGIVQSINYNSGKKIGYQLVQGLSVGLSYGKKNLTAVAKGIGDLVYKTTKDTLKIKSPSKKFAELGKYTDAGFVKGMLSGESDIKKTATSVMGKTIKAVYDSIDSSVDGQPTIRPVLDLTDIQNGASRIDSIMSGQTLSTSLQLANSNANSMNTRINQADITISQLSKLQDTLSSLNGRSSIEQTNNFNITGNDPNAIANEVSRILQQQVDRRNRTWGM